MDDKKVLIAYASVSGSTGEVAQAIGEVLQEQGMSVDVKSVKAATDLGAYDAFVIGSSIRAGRWLPEAMHFLEDHHDDLSSRSVAYFTTCLTMVDDTEDNRRTVLAYMEPILQKTPDVKPIGLGLFAGSLDPERQLAMQTIGPQGDYRNWQAIRAWADEIASALSEAGERSDDKSEGRYTIILRNAALAYTDLVGADLHGVDMTRADLYQARLSEADLHQATLNWAEMNWSDMSGADLSRANLIGAHLKHANVDGANMSHAILNGADLGYANLNGVNLSNADLNWADFHNADLSQANLSGARLGWSSLKGTNLTGVNLQNAKYNSATVWPDGFAPADHGAILVDVGPQ